MSYRGTGVLLRHTGCYRTAVRGEPCTLSGRFYSLRIRARNPREIIWIPRASVQPLTDSYTMQKSGGKKFQNF